MRPGLLVSVLVLWSVGPAAAQPTSRPSDNLLRRPALQAVVEAQVRRDGAALRSMLDDDNPAVRARAAFALASVQDTTAISALLSLLRDSVPLVRTDAAFALGQMPAEIPEAELLRALGFEKDARVQRRLIEALGKTGDAPSLRTLLRLNPPAVRDAEVALAVARYGMRGITDSTATEWLVAHLTSADATVRRNAAYAFGRVEALTRGRFDTLRSVLGTYGSDDPAAMHLVRALGPLDEPADVDRLTRRLRSSGDWRTRVNAGRALTGLTDTAAVRSALVKALDDPHPLVARTAAETLAGANWADAQTAAVGAWIDAHSGRWRVVAPLLRSLSRNGSSRRVLRTVNRWRTERSPVAYAAALPALAPLDAARAESLLVRPSRAEDPRVAAAAVEGLVARWERMRPDEKRTTFARLSAAVRRGDPALLYVGAPALADSAFATLSAADTLAAAYRTLAVPTDLEGMTSVLRALGTLGGSTAEAVLRDALDHPHPAIRTAAAAGLSAATDTTVTAAPKPLPDTPSINWDSLRALGPHPRLVLKTNRGQVTIELDAEQAPQTVQTIVRFAWDGRYDGVPFHRVVPNFVVQGGDFARRDGFGGPGFFLRTEITRIGHRRGTIGMASAGKDTEGSQFFIPHSMQPHLDGGYTAFGRVVEGMDVVDRLRVNDRIQTATVHPDPE